MKPKLLHSRLQSDEWYTEVWNKIAKDEADRWEEKVRTIAYNPTEIQLQEMKDLLKKDYNKSFTDEEARDAFMRLFVVGSLAVSAGVRKSYDQKKEKRVKEWMRRDRLKDKRTLAAIPFDNITCSICKSAMIYQWSDLWEEGIKNPVEKVMFFYRCQNECMNKIIFEDGTPWISKKDNSCAICKGERKATVTKDSSGKSYIIYECVNCKSRQVETLTD